VKGIIFKQFEAMVTSLHGEGAWDALVDRTPLQTAEGYFIGPKNYPDDDLFGLIGSVSEATGKPPEELLAAFGRYLFPALAAQFPVFLRPGITAKRFLLSVDRVIHVEVLKLHPDAGLPKLTYEDPAPNRLVILYRSPRQLCDLALGLIDGVGTYFKEDIQVSKTTCTKRGDEACRFECTFSERSG